MQIFLMVPSFRTTVLDVDHSISIKNLQEMIYDHYGIPKKLYYMTYGGKILAPETRVLSDFNIEKDSTIQVNYRAGSLEEKQMQIFVKNSGFNTIVLDVNSNFGVKYLEDKIQDKYGYPKNSFYLIHAGKKLLSNKMIGDYNIDNNSTIEVWTRVLGHCDICS